VTTKLVLRVLSAAGELLGWTEVQAEARGDGALWARTPPLVPIDDPGTPAVLSIHWADVNVELRVPYESGPVTPGMVLEIPNTTPLVKVGSPPVSLPPVTLRARIAVSVPVASVGALSQ
jgi:hypothetical protein